MKKLIILLIATSVLATNLFADWKVIMDRPTENKKANVILMMATGTSDQLTTFNVLAKAMQYKMTPVSAEVLHAAYTYCNTLKLPKDKVYFFKNTAKTIDIYVYWNGLDKSSIFCVEREAK